MQVAIYRHKNQNSHKSWRPKSLADDRGAVFPEDYYLMATKFVESKEEIMDSSLFSTGDIIVLDDVSHGLIYVAAPFGWEHVKLKLI